MGIETALVVGGLGLMQGIGQYNQAKSAARATAAEGDIVAKNRQKEIMMLASRQRLSYLQAGLELEGTPTNVITDTYNTGLADINNIYTNYRQSVKNQMTGARSQLLGNLAQTGLSMYMMSGMGGVPVKDVAGSSNFVGTSGNVTITNASYMG
jgi:hypothetical protein